jgi:hypothetical protein
MGTLEVMRDAFVRARDYKQAWDDYKAKKTNIPPRRDIRARADRRDPRRKAARACARLSIDEHLNLMLLADEFGFKVATLQHGLEAYKIAPEIARRGTGVSIFADSWSYKLEAYDSIPYNAYILWKNGVVVSINSDSDERMRRLNLDAAKMMKYGGVPKKNR